MEIQRIQHERFVNNYPILNALCGPKKFKNIFEFFEFRIVAYTSEGYQINVN